MHDCLAGLCGCGSATVAAGESLRGCAVERLWASLYLSGVFGHGITLPVAQLGGVHVGTGKSYIMHVLGCFVGYDCCKQESDCNWIVELL